MRTKKPFCFCDYWVHHDWLRFSVSWQHMHCTDWTVNVEALRASVNEIHGHISITMLYSVRGLQSISIQIWINCVIISVFTQICFLWDVNTLIDPCTTNEVMHTLYGKCCLCLITITFLFKAEEGIKKLASSLKTVMPCDFVHIGQHSHLVGTHASFLGFLYRNQHCIFLMHSTE